MSRGLGARSSEDRVLGGSGGIDLAGWGVKTKEHHIEPYSHARQLAANSNSAVRAEVKVHCTDQD